MIPTRCELSLRVIQWRASGSQAQRGTPLRRCGELVGICEFLRFELLLRPHHGAFEGPLIWVGGAGLEGRHHGSTEAFSADPDSVGQDG